jgi:hypothetical protein
MKGNTLNEFIDDMYHNPEKEISYCGERYMITGYVDESCELYTLEVYTIEKDSRELFKFTSKVRYECVEAFEKAKIFDGKTIYEAEKYIEVLFG